MELASSTRVAERARWPTERAAPQTLRLGIAAAQELLQESGWAWGHVQQVTRLAVQLFDQTAALHELPDSARPVLQAAALGHDIGYQRSHKRHHKESFPPAAQAAASAGR